jgi:hypothetical protein
MFTISSFCSWYAIVKIKKILYIVCPILAVHQCNVVDEFERYLISKLGVENILYSYI